MSIEIVLQLDADEGRDTTLVSESAANTNFGDDPEITLGTAQFVKAPRYLRGLFHIDLAAIPAGATIVDATLILKRGSGDEYDGNPVINLYRLVRADWTEFGATWNQYDGANAWTNPGGDFDPATADSITVTSSEQDLVFTALAALAADAIANRSGQLELVLVGPETEGMNYVNCYSSEADDPADRPKLVVHYEPPVVLLSVVDHGDGSGATATIGNTPPDVTNTIYVQSFGGELGGGAWGEVTALEGAGEVELELPAGHYFAYALSAQDAGPNLSAVVYFAVTDASESVHTRCLSSVQARIRLLALEGLDAENVVIEKLPVGRHLAQGLGLPTIVLSPHRAAMPAAAGNNRLDDVHYDVLVAMFDRDNQEPTLAAQLDRHFLWRQQIARAFRNQRLAGVPEVINCEVEPAEGVLDEAWKRELMTSAVVLRFTSRETRGF